MPEEATTDKYKPELDTQFMLDHIRVRPVIICVGGVPTDTARDTMLGLNGVDRQDEILKKILEYGNNPHLKLLEGNIPEATGFESSSELIEAALSMARVRDMKLLRDRLAELRSKFALTNLFGQKALESRELARARRELDDLFYFHEEPVVSNRPGPSINSSPLFLVTAWPNTVDKLPRNSVWKTEKAPPEPAPQPGE